MKKKIAEMWIKELKTTKAGQCKGSLCVERPRAKTDSFCVFGILIELYFQEKNNPKKYGWAESGIDFRGRSILSYEASHGDFFSLPKSFKRWAGLNNTEAYRFIQGLNDGGDTFKKLAKILEKDNFWKNL